MMYMLIILVSVALFCDVRSYKIPNAVTYAGMVVALLIGLGKCGPPGLLKVLLEALLIFTMLYPVYLCRGLGAGDVKLFMVIGGISGINMTLNIMIRSLVIAIILGIIKKFIYIFNSKSDIPILEKILREKTKIRFTPAIMLALVMITFIRR